MLDVGDPNWYLSTSAQSAAALVAIAGGFVLSRAIAVASEKNGLALRRNELKASISPWREEIEELTERINAKGVTRLAHNAQDRLVEDPDIPTSDLLSDGTYSLPRALAEETVEAVRVRVRGAYELLGPHVPPPNLFTEPSKHPMPMKELNLDPKTTRLGDAVLLEKVWKRLLPKSPFAIDLGMSRVGDMSALLNPAPDPAPAWLDQREKARSRHLELRGQLDYVEAELAKVNTPTGFKEITYALAYFTMTGVVAPLGVLTRQPKTLSPEILVLLFVGFVSGLAAVAFVVGRTVLAALKPVRMINIETTVEAIEKPVTPSP